MGGIPQSGQLDTVLVVDVDEEFESVIGHEEDMLPTGVSAEALERLTAIATDLAQPGEKESLLAPCSFWETMMRFTSGPNN